MRKGQLDEAATHYQKALEIQPQLSAVHSNLGIIFAQKEQSHEAKVHFLKAIEINRDDLNAHHNLGIIHAQGGMLEQAIIEFSEALRIAPGDEIARACLTKAQEMMQLKPNPQ